MNIEYDYNSPFYGIARWRMILLTRQIRDMAYFELNIDDAVNPVLK